MALNDIESNENTQDCELLTEFDSDPINVPWRVVNDNVMGGRSQGGMVFKDNTLIYEGFINTNGGGFSSIRYDFNDGTLNTYQSIKLRVRTQDHHLEYRMIFEDAYRGSIVYGCPLMLTKTKDWQEITMPLNSFKPSRRGYQLSQPTFDKKVASAMGFIISDTKDGNFKLEVDWIKGCK